MKREPGFYWARCKELWFVAEWDGHDWNTTQSSGIQDFDFDEIDERRIEREYHDGPKQAAESIWLINKLFKK